MATKPQYGKGKLVVDVIVPLALYYALRAGGASVYLSLLTGAIVPAVSTLISLTRTRTIDRLGAYVLATMLLGVAVSLIAGSPRFLLAKEAWVTAIAGIWFLISAMGSQPLTYLFARTIFEGNKQFTSEPWDSMWQRSPSFRRGWRISTVIWGIGLLIDAAIRVIIAYSLPVDVVPAVATALFPVTAVVLIVIDQVNQHYNGIRGMLLGHDPPAARGDDRGAAPGAGDATARRTTPPRSPGTGSSPVR